MRLDVENIVIVSKKKNPVPINRNRKINFIEWFFDGSIIELDITKEGFDKNGIGKKNFLKNNQKNNRNF